MYGELIPVSPTTTPQRAAEIRRRLMNPPKKKPIGLKPVEVVKERKPLDHNAHVLARVKYFLDNPHEMSSLIEASVKQATESGRRLPALPIIRQMCVYYGVKYADVQSDRRTKSIAFPRQKMMWVVKKTTHFSLPEIGRKFGHRDHTTVLHAVNKIQDLVAKQDPSVAELKRWVK